MEMSHRMRSGINNAICLFSVRAEGVFGNLRYHAAYHSLSRTMQLSNCGNMFSTSVHTSASQLLVQPVEQITVICFVKTLRLAPAETLCLSIPKRVEHVRIKFDLDTVETTFKS